MRRALIMLLTILAAIPVISPAEAAFPGSNGLITFTRGDQVFVIESDGSDERQLTHGGVNKSPAWSADGSRFVWACDGDICVADSDGSNVQRLTGAPEVEQRPSWSPDGEWIVFTRPGQDVSDQFGAPSARIYKMEVSDPNNIVQLTDFPSTDPEWSPNGQRIAFFRGWSHGGEVWLMRPDGTRAHAINKRYRQGATPSWSPDGRRIALMAKRRNRWRVAVITAHGRLIREFGFERATALGVAWSPDGRRFAYVGATEQQQEALFVVRPDGTQTERLGYQGRAPDWQPQ